jgi:hypothetical protein
MLVIFVVWMERHFRRRKPKNQSPVPRLEGTKSKNVTKEFAICLRVF